MILGEPPRTQADLNFRLFNIPVRVSPWFWLAAVLLGWHGTRGDPHLLLSWIAAVFLSILIHEFGHAFAFKYFGTGSHVVLYHFGGLAIPDSQFGRVISTRSDPQSRILISIAGPAIQLFAASIVVALLVATGHGVLHGYAGFVASTFRKLGGTPLEPASLRYFVDDFLYVSIYWAILNLMPVYPLDGGQISRELFLMYDRGDSIRNSLILSILTGGFLAIVGISQGRTYMGILFGMLAFSSYQILQAHSGHGGGFGGFGNRRDW